MSAVPFRRNPTAVPSWSVAATREQRRSLFLHRRIAEAVAADPDAAFARACRTLDTARRANADGSADRWLDAWAVLLEGPLEVVLEVLTADTPEAAELRATSPFAGVLAPQPRWAAYREFREQDAGAG